MHRTAALALALAAGSASAQSFNIDFNVTSGAGAGTPAMNFGGAAGQTGYWNSITGSSPAVVTLSELDSAPSAVTMSRTGTATFTSTNSASTSGDREKLMDDYAQVTGFDTLALTFNNLQDGLYVIYTTAADPGSAFNLGTVNVPNTAQYCSPTQYIGGAIPAGGYKAGDTHAVHTVNVTSGQLTVNIACTFNQVGIISGLQLVRLAGPASKRVIYVDTNAAGANDGGSWLNACNDLQAALAAADLGGGSHFQVWVANGFYYPGASRSDTFSIPTGLEIYGGFAGGEMSLLQRTAWSVNATYLSGAIGSSAASDNCYTVVTLDASDSNTLVDGFYIASGYNSDTGFGGGMRITTAISPQVRNCSFTSNQASLGGGAVYISGSTGDITNCTFYNNQAFNGQGGAVYMSSPVGTTWRIHNSRFLGNYALGAAGAVYTSGMYLDLANDFFSGNNSGDEGGAILALGSSQVLTAINCTFSRNASAHNSGGIYAAGGLDVQVRNSILWGNTGGNAGPLNVQQVSTFTGQGSNLTVSFNTIQGQNADPLFIDADGADNDPGNFDDNCRLKQASPCIDAADASVLPLDQGDTDMNGVWNEPLPVDIDLDPRRVEIASVANTGPGASPVIDRGCYEFQLGQLCYANCDNSTVAPVLNVQDFSCFLNKFAAGDAYANCDNSSVAPTLNVQDFSCFLNKFAAGCP